MFESIKSLFSSGSDKSSKKSAKGTDNSSGKPTPPKPQPVAEPFTLVTVSYRADLKNPKWGLDAVNGIPYEPGKNCHAMKYWTPNNLDFVEIIDKSFKGVDRFFKCHNPFVQTYNGRPIICAIYWNSGKVVPLCTQKAQFDANDYCYDDHPLLSGAGFSYHGTSIEDRPVGEQLSLIQEWSGVDMSPYFRIECPLKLHRYRRRMQPGETIGRSHASEENYLYVYVDFTGIKGSFEAPKLSNHGSLEEAQAIEYEYWQQVTNFPYAY